MSRYDALQLATSAELDLVEVSPTAEPPVVRIMDYGKFLFEQNKKTHAAKRKQKQIQVKEVKFRPGTEEGTAMGEIIRFPDEASCTRVGRYIDATTEPATVIILPVIRIERAPDGSNDVEPTSGNSSGRRRRRRIGR